MDFLIYAIIGGLIPDAIRLIKNRYGSTPHYLTNINFYIGLILLVGLGVFAVYLKDPKDKVETLAIAFSAPQVISSLLGNKLRAPIVPNNGPTNLMNTDDAQDSNAGGLRSFLTNWW